MNKLLLFLLLFAGMANAQIVNIPDVNFKADLIEASPTVQWAQNFSDEWMTIDANGDGEIQVSEAQAVKLLIVHHYAITDVTGLESFSNLETLRFQNNQIVTLNFSPMPSLKTLNLFGTGQLTSLNISNLTNLTSFQAIALNNLSTLDFSNLANLTQIGCSFSSINSINLTGVVNLDHLVVMGNMLTSLDVSGSPLLTKLNCSSNAITNLNVNDLDYLTELDCSQNQLLNLNGIPNVNKLNCSHNKLTSFAIGNLTNLSELDCSYNDIANLNVANLSNLTKINCAGNKLVTLNIDGLPLLTQLDSGSNAELTNVTLSNLQALEDFSVMGIYNGQNPNGQTGIVSQLTTLNLNNLPNLQRLNCSYGVLTSLNLSNLGSLKELDCSYNLITSLNVSNLPNLEKLYCAANHITNLDVSSLSNLTDLACAGAYVTDGMMNAYLQNLNVAGLSNLKTLNCSYGLFTNLDLTGLDSLETLNCDGVPNGLGTLTALNVNNLTNLKNLNCAFQHLTSLNVSNLAHLENLSCSYNQITNLDLTGLVSLKTLDYNYNYLSNLNLVNLPSLETLVCANNHLITLNVLNLTNLKSLNCSYNELTTLNLSDLTSLETLDYSFNQLTLSNVSGLSTNLKSLSCGGNDLTSLDVAGLTSLETLSCHTNQLTSLDLSTLNNLKTLDCSLNQLSVLEVGNLTHLESLNCANNQLTSLDISAQNGLTLLYCGSNQLTSLDLTNHLPLMLLDYSFNSLPDLDVAYLSNLTLLGCAGTQTTALDVSNMPNLQNLTCAQNQLTTLDINNCHYLVTVNTSDNLLSTLFMKNGRNDSISFNGNPTLQYICADTNELESTQTILNNLGMNTTVSNSYCTFSPGGDFNTIEGIAIYDINNDGCDVTDEVNPFVRFDITDGVTTGATVTNINGEYGFFTNAGTYTVFPNVENQQWFNFSPTSAEVTFLNNNNNQAVQNFCIAAIGTHSDVEVVLVPIDWARPGFDATYKIIYKNKGNQMLSGTVNLTFDDSVLDLITAFPAISSTAANMLSWDYVNLMPFENRSIDLLFNVNSPVETPAVNNGDILNFTASVTPVSADEIPADNQFTLAQTVVGSYDPNAKTCLEGDIVSPTEIGNYLHYNIQFENLGTAEAVNVVVRDSIDTTKFDISTLQVLYSSHPVRGVIRGNVAEFMFENINLAPAAGDPPVGGHGNVLFKIKTLATLSEGDHVENKADIFFDYNAPIATELARTTYQTLNSGEFEQDKNISVYPNPANGIVNIKSTSVIKSVELYDIQGRLLQTSLETNNTAILDISSRSNGIYFLKITTDEGSKVEKLLKQ
ncbi:DUF7619 domain-containing protein [Flavobacterium silvaticum]|uniref:T9SS type A sorting domain-containing protein n=1 Tax=Flavobacterium silvaticum TaxID=1852020 RepID=A0A972FM04_9FLAO|nr:leucine-rich repeat domain-containing protein [Flavobacterium silvaticum]NMH28112.1 T9SS type A sorting domain-containing protein [Flavobacterium silvaticum]